MFFLFRVMNLRTGSSNIRKQPMPWMIPTGPDDYLRLTEEVDRERFAVHMDVINMINAVDRYIRKVGSELRYIMSFTGFAHVEDIDDSVLHRM